MILPVENPTKSYWIEAADSPLKDHRTTDDLPQKTDVLIVGGGYTGMTVAYWLTRYTPNPPKICLLEARGISTGASGRNGGLLRPHYFSHYTEFEESCPGHGKAIIDHEVAHLQAFADLMKEETIDCSYAMSHTYGVAMAAEGAKYFQIEYDALKRDHGEEAVRKVEKFEGEEAESVTRIKGAVTAWKYPGGQIWPYKFVHGLMQKMLDRQQINVQSNTPVLSISDEKDAEGYFTVNTKRGQVKAKTIVHANNRWADQLLPELKGLVQPGRSTVSAVVPAPAFVEKPFDGAISTFWGGSTYDYFVQLPPPHNIIIVGGGMKVINENRAMTVNNDKEDEHIPGIAEYFTKWGRETCVGWDGEDKLVEGYGSWTGTKGVSIDEMPFVGEVPGRKDNFISAVYSGHGMPRILLSSAYLAPLILEALGEQVEVPEHHKAYPPLPEPYKITEERLERCRGLSEDWMKSAAELEDKSAELGK